MPLLRKNAMLGGRAARVIYQAWIGATIKEKTNKRDVSNCSGKHQGGRAIYPRVFCACVLVRVGTVFDQSLDGALLAKVCCEEDEPMAHACEVRKPEEQLLQRGHAAVAHDAAELVGLQELRDVKVAPGTDSLAELDCEAVGTHGSVYTFSIFQDI